MITRHTLSHRSAINNLMAVASVEELSDDSSDLLSGLKYPLKATSSSLLVILTVGCIS